MIRNGLQDRAAYLEAAFATLADEHVGAVVVAGALRENHQLIDRMISAFDLDRRAVFTWHDATVYLPVESRLASIRKLLDRPFHDVKLAADAVLPAPGSLGGEWRLVRDLEAEQQAIFSAMTPQPTGFYSSFGPALEWRQGEPWFNAHPTTRLRFELPAGRRHLQTKVILPEATYATPGNAPTDGVEIQLVLREAGASPRVVYARLVDPFRVAADRGEQKIEVTFELSQAAQVDLLFGPGPGGRDTRDWISLGRVIFN